MRLVAFLLFWHVWFAACDVDHANVVEVEPKQWEPLGLIAAGFGTAGLFGYFTTPRGNRVKIRKDRINWKEIRKASRNPNKYLKNKNREYSMKKGQKMFDQRQQERRQQNGGSSGATKAGASPTWDKDMTDEQISQAMTDEENEKVDKCLSKSILTHADIQAGARPPTGFPDYYLEPDVYLFFPHARHDCLTEMLLAKVNPESKADRDQILSRDEDGKPVAREVDVPVPQRQKTKAETMASLREEYPSTVLKIVDGSPSMSERIFGTVDSVVHGAKKAFGFDPKRGTKASSNREVMTLGKFMSTVRPPPQPSSRQRRSATPARNTSRGFDRGGAFRSDPQPSPTGTLDDVKDVLLPSAAVGCRIENGSLWVATTRYLEAPSRPMGNNAPSSIAPSGP
ncbi:MAG: hypothetical protein M1815_002148 [Lichina confinis]|nr:MAG: hypothetical protein M1815_002148 [Lichina confinis]